MVDLDLLAKRARRASEWGRVRVGCRGGALALVLVVLSAVAGSPKVAVLGLGTLLVCASVALGWWNAEGARAVRSGLVLGAVPMIAGLVTLAVEGWCDPEHAMTACGAGCLLAGLVAGGGSAWYATATAPRRRLRVWVQIGLVASLTTALGCVGLGTGSALAVLAAIAAGALIGWIPAWSRARA
jgi:hypothetical protein